MRPKVYLYSPGDTVRIREDLEEDARYYMEGDEPASDIVVESMLPYRGQTARVTRCFGKYKIDLDGGLLNWVDGMFERDAPDFMASDMPIGALLGERG